MKQIEAFFMVFIVLAASFLGMWFGTALGLSACARDGEFKHKLLNTTVYCEVRK